MTTISVGTDKGLFQFERTPKGWRQTGDVGFLGWRVTALGRAPSGRHLAGVGSGWFAPAVHRSDDGTAWEQVVDGPAYPEGGPELSQIWKFLATGPRLFCGVAEAGLFRSDDDGDSWAPVEGLNGHPTRARWQEGGGGLCAHALLAHPSNPQRLWCGISAVGTFRTDDGGETWHPCNEGVAIAAPDEPAGEGAAGLAAEGAAEDGIGYCVHGLVLDAQDPDRLYRQDHMGVYRSRDAGQTWEVAETGLPARFGFPIARSGQRLFVAPQASDEHRIPPGGRLRIYRSDDGASSWEESGTGLPDTPVYAGVLRGALDATEAGTVAFGTTSGDLWCSGDAGETWEPIDIRLPRVFAVAVDDH